MSMQKIFSVVGPRKVRVSRLGVLLFNGQWPCSKLDSRRAYWFEFDMRGDLVDANVPERNDGPPEAVALCKDAQAWLENSTIPDWCKNIEVFA